MRLQTIHPNPGPRDQTEEGIRIRRERRKARRTEKRSLRAEQRREEAAGRKKEELVVATWNVQRMTVEGMRNTMQQTGLGELGSVFSGVCSGGARFA